MAAQSNFVMLYVDEHCGKSHSYEPVLLFEAKCTGTEIFDKVCGYLIEDTCIANDIVEAIDRVLGEKGYAYDPLIDEDLNSRVAWDAKHPQHTEGVSAVAEVARRLRLACSGDDKVSLIEFFTSLYVGCARVTLFEDPSGILRRLHNTGCNLGFDAK